MLSLSASSATVKCADRTSAPAKKPKLMQLQQVSKTQQKAWANQVIWQLREAKLTLQILLLEDTGWKTAQHYPQGAHTPHPMSCTWDMLAHVTSISVLVLNRCQETFARSEPSKRLCSNHKPASPVAVAHIVLISLNRPPNKFPYCVLIFLSVFYYGKFFLKPYHRYLLLTL